MNVVSIRFKERPINKKGEVKAQLLNKNKDIVPVEVISDFDLDKCDHIIDLVTIDNRHLFSKIKNTIDGENETIIFEQIKNSDWKHLVVPIELRNAPVKLKDRVHQSLRSISIYSKEQRLPSILKLNISKIKIGEIIKLKDIKPPNGIEFSDKDLNRAVVSCL